LGSNLEAVALRPVGASRSLADAIRDGGGCLVEPADASSLIWAGRPESVELADLVGRWGHLGWIHLPWAGIEGYVDVIRTHPDRTWTSSKGVFAEPVAEMALALVLAGKRHLATYIRDPTDLDPAGTNLGGDRVVIVGGGGICESLLRLLRPFGCEVTVVRRHPAPMAGAGRVAGESDLDQALTGADVVVLALALTAASEGLMDQRRLRLLSSGAWLVNVARGRHVVTHDLVAVLREGRLGGAALDVTDPEPLPVDHPLRALPNVIVTPHVANTPGMADPLLCVRVRENVRRRCNGLPLVGGVSPSDGY
jgi:phosphoglycerate dehydrogenase-like enzyme